MAKSFGTFLKDLRKSRHLTLRQVEERVHVSNAYLSQIERGERGIPNYKILTKLAAAYGVSVAKLLLAAEEETEDTVASATSPQSRSATILSMVENVEGQDERQPHMHSSANEHLQEGYASLTSEKQQSLIDYLDFLLYKQQHESRHSEQDV